MGRGLIIYGAGGHGRVLLEIARACRVEVDAFIVDDLCAGPVSGLPVFAAHEWQGASGCKFVVAIGANHARAKIFTAWKRKLEAVSLIHPFTFVSPTSTVDSGTVVMAGVVINANTRIGENVILNTSSSIDHDCVIASHVHVCPGVRLAGGVHVGGGTMIGIGSSVIPGIKIGSNCLIGAGSVVVRDVPANSKAYGNPARVVGSVKQISDEF